MTAADILLEFASTITNGGAFLLLDDADECQAKSGEEGLEAPCMDGMSSMQLPPETVKATGMRSDN